VMSFLCPNIRKGVTEGVPDGGPQSRKMKQTCVVATPGDVR